MSNLATPGSESRSFLPRFLWGFLFVLTLLAATVARGAVPVSLNLTTIDGILAQGRPGDESVFIDDMGFKVVYLEEIRAGILSGQQAASPNGITKWTNGIVPYEFDANVDSTQQQQFIAACNEWQKFAKVTFVARTGQTKYLHVNSSTSNSSYVGMQGGQQLINIFNWDYKYIICHELAHALGMAHEHSRSDRDSYVTIVTANIIPAAVRNFDLQSTVNYNTYDFGSVMHYPRAAFSANGQDTIVPKQGYEDAGLSMGQRTQLSVSDRQGMANSYGGPDLAFFNPGWSGDVILSASQGNHTHQTTFSPTDTIYVDISPGNAGTIPIPSAWHLKIFVDGVSKYDQVSLSGLGANATDPNFVDKSIGTLTAGTHTVRVVLDALNEIGEVDETAADNERSLTVNVGASINVSANPVEGGAVSGDGTFAVGSNRTVIATANPGYYFVSWTEGGPEVSGSSSYNFTLLGNRDLVANFTQFTQTLAVSASPDGGGNVSGGGVFARGSTQAAKAMRNIGYVFVNWTENGTEVSTASSYPFTLSVDRVLVANFIAANYNLNVTAVPSQMGTVTGGGTFGAGNPCTAVASPNVGFVFVNWTEGGNEVSKSASYQFTLDGHRSLVANFAPRLEVDVLKGKYEGLVQTLPGESVTVEGYGSVTIKLTKTGTFSSALLVGGVRKSVKGKFDSAGDSGAITVSDKGAPLYSVELHLDGGNPDGEITGTLDRSGVQSLVRAKRSLYDAKLNPAPQAGRYTFIVRPGAAVLGDPSFPQGAGEGDFEVKLNGAAKLRATLPDGSKFSRSARVAPDDSWPLFALPNGKEGFLGGWLIFKPVVGVSDGEVALDWGKPVTKKFFTQAFVTRYDGLLSKYQYDKGVMLLPFAAKDSNALFRLHDGDLVPLPVDRLITLGANNKVTNLFGDQFKLTITTKTGRFSGYFPDQNTGNARKFSGVIFQAKKMGFGWFSGDSKTGGVLLDAAP